MTTTQPSTSARRGTLRRKFWRARKHAVRGVVGLPTSQLRELPDFMVIGAQRSGTTSLYRHLSAHPGVTWPALVKSPHWHDANYDKPERWYRAHFPLAATLRRNGTITGEASPYFLYHPHVPARIAAHAPDTRLVAILRDPVSRAWSHYHHEVARGNEQLDFPTALDREDERIEPELDDLAIPGHVASHHRHHGYVRRGLYAEQLERYHEHFPAGQLHVVLTDDLKAAPQATFDDICDFLGLDRWELPQATRHHARSYPVMGDEVRARLEERFREPNRQLATLLGRDLPWSSA